MHVPGIAALTMTHILICTVLKCLLKYKSVHCLFCFVFNVLESINFFTLISFLIFLIPAFLLQA